MIEKKFIQLSKPSLRDQASDLERILAQVGKNKKVAFSLLGGLPEIVRKADFEVTAVLVAGADCTAVEPGDTHALRYGFILDIGTTTIAVYLAFDLLSGEVLDADGTADPQRVFGADVLSRIIAAAGRENLEKMQAVTIKGISETMRGLLRSLSIDENHVYSVVAVGNTTMSHLFLGVDPKICLVAPFIPCYRPRTVVKGGRLGLPMHPEGTVHVLANISGYVGSDTLGVAMATKLWEQKGYSLAVDIGTNGEIILGYKGWLLACSAAAGPAFEGAHIQNGMRAGDGAIRERPARKRHRPVGGNRRYASAGNLRFRAHRRGGRTAPLRPAGSLGSACGRKVPGTFPASRGQVTHGRRYAGICVGLCWRAGQRTGHCHYAEGYPGTPACQGRHCGGHCGSA